MGASFRISDIFQCRKPSFREDLKSEAQVPGITLLGSSVNEGNPSLYVLLCTKSYFWVGEILLLEDAIALLISQSTHTAVVSLEKEGDLNGKGFNRGTLRNGSLLGSDKRQKHPARPKHRSSAPPFKRY